MAHDRIIGLYEENAAAWAAIRRSATAEEQPHLDDFAEALPAGATVLDIGCGSGVPIAERLIARGFDLTGVDSSPSLIAICRQRFPSATWTVADMRQLELGRRFDGVLAWYSVFHLSPDDQRAMFPVFARHAAPGAILAFISGAGEGVRIGEWQGEPLYHASLSPDEYRVLLAANGFEVLSFAGREPGPSVWMARAV